MAEINSLPSYSAHRISHRDAPPSATLLPSTDDAGPSAPTDEKKAPPLNVASPPISDLTLREALKRCAPATYAAAVRFRATGDCGEIPTIIRGVIARFVESDRRERLQLATPGLRLIEDLGIDSLTMMEIVMLAEEALPLSISNEELRPLRTLGEVEEFIISKLRGLPPPIASGSGNWYLDDLDRTADKSHRPSPHPSDRPAA